eukprot:1509821-Prymnesium_polylepis.1
MATRRLAVGWSFSRPSNEKTRSIDSPVCAMSSPHCTTTPPRSRQPHTAIGGGEDRRPVKTCRV